MAALKPSDYYYGAFLSVLLNYGKLKPSLFNPSETRRVYQVTTNTSKDDYYIYCKYAKVRPSKNPDQHWVFNFSNAEICYLQEMHSKKMSVKLALICITSDLKGGELALIDYETAIKCLGLDIGIQRSKRIDVKISPKSHNLGVYGSGRADKVNGKDNTISVKRNSVRSL